MKSHAFYSQANLCRICIEVHRQMGDILTFFGVLLPTKGLLPPFCPVFG
jgi:hypothetical protein